MKKVMEKGIQETKTVLGSFKKSNDSMIDKRVGDSTEGPITVGNQSRWISYRWNGSTGPDRHGEKKNERQNNKERKQGERERETKDKKRQPEGEKCWQKH